MIFPTLAIVASVFVGPQPQTYVEIYDISDFSHLVPDFSIETKLNLESALRGRPLVSNPQSNVNNKERFNIDSFIQLLHVLVDPQNNGPTEIKHWRGNLIINTSKEYHNRIRFFN